MNRKSLKESGRICKGARQVGRHALGTLALLVAPSVLGCGGEGTDGAGGDATVAPGPTLDGLEGLGSEGAGPLDLSAGGDSTAPGACIELAVAFEKLTPTVVVLVDRSGSMSEDFANADRWNVLRDTLVDPVNGVIAQFDEDVRFGLTMYTSIDGNAGPNGCPLLVDVDVALSNFDTIADVYSSTELLNDSSDTPTSESLRAVTARLALEPGPKAIILATDGNPDTCVDPDDHSTNSQRLSEAAVEDAFALGIETFVISVGDEVTQDHLQNIANLGVGAARNADEPFYQATDAGALANAFNTIVTGVATCEFELSGTVQPADAALGTVLVGGTAAAFGEDWDLPSESRLRLLGDTCDSFRQEGGQVDISFPCGAFLIK